MSLRYTCHLFHTGDAAGFRRAFEDTARSLGGQVEWGKADGDGDLVRTGTSPTVQTLEVHGDAWSLLQPLTAAVGVPMMELRIQEEALWDYSLLRGPETVDTFSTLPQYWNYPEEPDADHLAKWLGKPRLLAELWQVPFERIERYFVNWGMQPDPDDSGVFNHVLDGKAYASDQHPYGECRQMFDFLSALGGTLPNEDHRVRLPGRR